MTVLWPPHLHECVTHTCVQTIHTDFLHYLHTIIDTYLFFFASLNKSSVPANLHFMLSKVKVTWLGSPFWRAVYDISCV